MTGYFWLDWAAIAVSLINTIILIWLGVTVLFNSEQRSWGGWLAAIGLLLGGTFFISHTAILGYGLNIYATGLNLWWVVGLIAVALLPFIWYVMMLWYSGYWQPLPPEESNTLRKRHQIWFLLSILFLIGLLGLTLLSSSQSDFQSYPARGLDEAYSYNNFPLIIVFYPLYVIFCIALAFDALRKPGPSDRVMGQLARVRARPWLMGASLILLMVSMGVSLVFVWLENYTDNLASLYQSSVIIGLFDLVIESLILGAVVMLGQAVVAYEIFTGKTLPRQELLRQWRRLVIFAGGYGIAIGFTFSTNLRPIYAVLLSTMMLTFFFAMLSLRSYQERERYIRSLRPFVSSQRFYDQLLTRSAEGDSQNSMQLTFNAICEEMLTTQQGYLIALGPLAPLVGAPLSYPPGTPVDADRLNEIIRQLDPSSGVDDLTSQGYPDIHWAVPLWSQRGLIGMLFFGRKVDLGVYAQEEIEVAQASCERLIDTLASLEIAQRLMDLQRRRLAQSQVLDQRTRRVLHDDVLQQLHTAILNLAGDEPANAEGIEILSGVHSQISNLLHELPPTSLPEISRLGVVGALRKLLDEELGTGFDAVDWQIETEDEEKAKVLPPLESEVIYYAAREAIRNAGKHARGNQPAGELTLTIRLRFDPGLLVTIEDNGSGISEAPRSDENGGQGLALHSTMMAVIGGELAVESEPGRFTRVSLSMPEILQSN
ncbi:MAG: ATP-binding protein [Chloroflexota bacterium]